MAKETTESLSALCGGSVAVLDGGLAKEINCAINDGASGIA